MFVASFDIGKCNFAFCIERFEQSILHKIKSIQKSLRYTKDGECTLEFQPIIDAVCMEGELVLHKNIDITEGSNKKKSLDDIILLNMYKTLDEFASYFDKCDIILIEQQMSFGANKTNTMAMKLSQHCKSYFIYKYRETKEVVDFPAYHKTQILGATKAMTKPQRKKWAVEKAVDILLQRGDLDTVDMISEKKKRDDLADVFIQLQAFKFLRFVD
jgi:hypothetical protein